MSNRFVAVEYNGHSCCMEASVIDMDKPYLLSNGEQFVRSDGTPVYHGICECFSLSDAELIAEALNSYDRKEVK